MSTLYLVLITGSWNFDEYGNKKAVRKFLKGKTDFSKHGFALEVIPYVFPSSFALENAENILGKVFSVLEYNCIGNDKSFAWFREDELDLGESDTDSDTGSDTDSDTGSDEDEEEVKN